MATQSWQAGLIDRLLKLLGGSKGFADSDVIRQRVLKLADKPQRYAPTKRFVRDLDVTSRTVNGTVVYALKPRGTSPKRRVFYLHGGAYINEINPLHWRALRMIVLASGVQLDVPIYGLAPGATAGVTVPAMTDLLEQLVDEVGAEHVTLMGDSAGGGMALAVAQVLRDRGKQPRDLVLLSPWLDVTQSDPGQEAIVPFDLMLRAPGLTECGRQYSGGLALTDPLVSPLYGSVEGLAPVTVYVGTHEILNTDAHALIALYEAAGQQATLVEQPQMQHVYPLLPLLPEAAQARKAIAAGLR